MGAEATTKVFAICYLEKVLIYQQEMRFLDYIVSYQGIQIEKEQINIVRNWPELQWVSDI